MLAALFNSPGCIDIQLTRATGSSPIATSPATFETFSPQSMLKFVDS